MNILKTKTKITEWRAKPDTPVAMGRGYCYTFKIPDRDRREAVLVFHGNIHGKGFEKEVERYNAVDFLNDYEVVKTMSLK